MKSESVLVIKAHNPYEARYPSRRVIHRSALDFMKTARTMGYSVGVEPEDGRPLQYWEEKGLLDLLQDPLFILISGIPLNIAVGLLTSWLYDRLKTLNLPPSTPTMSHVIIESDDRSGTFRYDHTGQPVSDDRVKQILTFMSDRQRAYAKSIALASPYPDMPFPIHLEHTNRVVGWARFSASDTERAIIADPVRITDDDTWRRIQVGELQGLSIAIIVRRSQCSICRAEYVTCDHVSGFAYEGKNCLNTVTAFDLCEVSLVREPINPKALIRAKRKDDA